MTYAFPAVITKRSKMCDLVYFRDDMRPARRLCWLWCLVCRFFEVKTSSIVFIELHDSVWRIDKSLLFYVRLAVIYRYDPLFGLWGKGSQAVCRVCSPEPIDICIYSWPLCMSPLSIDAYNMVSSISRRSFLLLLDFYLSERPFVSWCCQYSHDWCGVVK